MDISQMAWNGEVLCHDVGVVAGEMISIVPMIFNHRVVTGSPTDRSAYEHGWCYPSMLAALAAVAVWDPATQSEPVGYIKRATPGLRPIPEGAST